MPADLVDRFALALRRLRPDGGRIGLAISGGPDSMAMLLLAHAAIPGEFEVGTVDHGLRAEAAAECALVERQCRGLGVECTILKVEVGGGNVQDAARLARYLGLGAWAEDHRLAAIVTAHHADDQAETLLMRLNRGSGLAGLAGVREASPFTGCKFTVPVIRPLLGFRRAELERVIAAAGVAVAHDPSNCDLRFDRVRIRKAIADAHWLDPLAISRSAGHLADADEALEIFANFLQVDNVRREGSEFRVHPNLPRAVALRIVGRIIAELGCKPRGGEVARLIERLEAGEGGNLGGVLATVHGDEWLFRPEPPRSPR